MIIRWNLLLLSWCFVIGSTMAIWVFQRMFIQWDDMADSEQSVIQWCHQHFLQHEPLPFPSHEFKWDFVFFYNHFSFFLAQKDMIHHHFGYVSLDWTSLGPRYINNNASVFL